MRELIKHIDFTKTNSLDKSIFNVAVGDKWANSELQRYVDSKENILFDNGLVLRATLENGIYSSARINTKNKFFIKYGYIEITAKVPKGLGTWPALWMLSQDNEFGHWPRSGEIDIMEHVGRNEDNIFMCLHTEAYNHTREEQYYKEKKISNATTEFHKYAIDWQRDYIAYYIDDVMMVKYSKHEKEDQTHKGWPFDHNFYLIMNLAIGGKFGGPVDDTIFPVDFIIKEIKFYKDEV